MIDVVFSGIGATLMMFVGAASTVDAIGIYFGAEEQKALSEEAALKTTTPTPASDRVTRHRLRDHSVATNV